MKKIEQVLIIFIMLTFIFTACEKDDIIDDDNPDAAENTEYVLQIENGAQTIEPNQTISYSAVFVDNNGNVTAATDVSWSVSKTSVATISSSGLLVSVGSGDAKVTATATIDGHSYTASVPIGIYPASLFAVAPSAIIYETGGEIQLETVYFTTGNNPTYSYRSSNTSVAEVSAGGLVSFVGTGECLISITASTLPNNPVYVPVLVVGIPDVALPVTRIELNKSALDLFKDETYKLTATAYNPDGIVNDASFTWASLDHNIATVNQDGLISPVKSGKTYIQVSSQGIIAQAELIVNPDTVVIVTPFYKDLEPGESFQFTAKAYKAERAGLTTEYPVTFNWSVLDYGAGFEMFNIGTVNADGVLTVKSDAMIGLSSFVIAQDASNPYIGGAGMVTVGFGFPGY